LSHDVLAAIVEVVSGKQFGEFVKENIFDVVGMKRSTFLLPDEELSEVAAQYRYDSESGQYIPCSKGVQITKFGSKYESGGGGCISTVDDYIAFLSDDGKFEFGFSKGKLKRIFYFYNSNKRDKLSLHILPYNYDDEVYKRWLKSYQQNEWEPYMVLCTDNGGDNIDEEEWFETYGKIFYSDLEPYRKKLIDFFGFDLFKEGFWLES
jgi:CubicO group peptidase (beta-lactamase class C family)